MTEKMTTGIRKSVTWKNVCSLYQLCSEEEVGSPSAPSTNESLCSRWRKYLNKSTKRCADDPPLSDQHRALATCHCNVRAEIPTHRSARLEQIGYGRGREHSTRDTHIRVYDEPECDRVGIHQRTQTHTHTHTHTHTRMQLQPSLCLNICRRGTN